jgi:hypothetical protein
MGRLRERWRDPLLTIVTILILFMLFVAPPLEAINLHLIHEFAFVVTLAVIVRIFVMSGNLIAVIAMLIAICMAGASTVLRLKGPSILDIYLLAGTWLIMGITIGG